MPDITRPPEAAAAALVHGTAPAQSFAAALVSRHPIRQPEQSPPATFPPHDKVDDRPGRIGARPRSNEEAGTPGGELPAAAKRMQPRATPSAAASSPRASLAFMAQALAQREAEPEPSTQAIRTAVAAYGRGGGTAPPRQFGPEILPRLASGRMIDLAV